MKISFDHSKGSDDYIDILTAKSADGLPIVIAFEKGEPDTIDFSGVEFIANSDDYKGLYVRFHDIVPVAEVILQASLALPEILSEAATEAENWARHVNSFSSPM